MKFIPGLILFIFPIVCCTWFIPEVVFNSSFRSIANAVPGIIISFLSLVLWSQLSWMKWLRQRFAITFLFELGLLSLYVFLLRELTRV